jgi:hypothetical protein
MYHTYEFTQLFESAEMFQFFLRHKPRGASPGREDGISTNNLVLFYGVE